MSAKADELVRKLIRNFDEVEKTAELRLPLYETLSARLGTNTSAKHLGASIDIVAAGKRSCPYHFHHAQEEMFVILEGDGTLRVADELIPIKAGDVIFIPPVLSIRIRSLTHRKRRSNTSRSAHETTRKSLSIRTRGSTRRSFAARRRHPFALFSEKVIPLITGMMNPRSAVWLDARTLSDRSEVSS
jgi:mannose-6-phosphate isomerase-like protein (cupin superfamily)